MATPALSSTWNEDEMEGQSKEIPRKVDIEDRAWYTKMQERTKWRQSARQAWQRTPRADCKKMKEEWEQLADDDASWQA